MTPCTIICHRIQSSVCPQGYRYKYQQDAKCAMKAGYTSLQSSEAMVLSGGAASSANSGGQSVLAMLCPWHGEAAAAVLGRLLQRVYAASSAFFLTVIVLSRSLLTCKKAC